MLFWWANTANNPCWAFHSKLRRKRRLYHKGWEIRIAFSCWRVPNAEIGKTIQMQSRYNYINQSKLYWYECQPRKANIPAFESDRLRKDHSRMHTRVRLISTWSKRSPILFSLTFWKGLRDDVQEMRLIAILTYKDGMVKTHFFTITKRRVAVSKDAPSTKHFALLSELSMHCKQHL